MATDTIASPIIDTNTLDENPKRRAQEVYFTVNAKGKGAVTDNENDAVVIETLVSGPFPTKPYPFWCSVRFLAITLLGFVGSMNLYAMRVNLSIALPCMVYINDTKNEPINGQNASSSTIISLVASCTRTLTPNSTDSSGVRFKIGLLSHFVYA